MFLYCSQLPCNENAQVGRTPLHEAVRQGDVATTQTLIAAGADVGAEDDNCATPFDLAIDNSPCHGLLQHHAAVLATTKDNPAALISSAFVHCATLSGSKDSVQAPALPLHAFQLDPSFLWAPHQARSLVFKWARNAFIAQLAVITEPFEELPEDCAGDILAFLEMAMTREESLQIARHCAWPEAHFWVRAVMAAAIAVSLGACLLENTSKDLSTLF